MKYLVIGAGGTGGVIAGYMAKAGKDVTLLARGKHLEAIKAKGLKIIRPADEFTVTIKAVSEEEYSDKADVIFVCVKGYSLNDIVPVIKKAAHNNTIVIPILNIFSTGVTLQEQLPELLVTDGCIYVASMIKEAGCILMKGNILRVIFGVRNSSEYKDALKDVEKDLKESNIEGTLSNCIRKDALMKFSYVSPQGACGVFYNVPAGSIQKDGIYRDCFSELVHEIDMLANAMDIHFDEDIVKRNLKILDELDPSATTSMQRDIAEGKKSEVDGLIYEVIRLATSYGIKLPEYAKIAKELKNRGIS
ncbi:MAG: 2-dehydropantoate 2-reductase [Butyrivibrio sp.]|nr:2-dehydropantoate 2-reductase [Butyrivibrio sp.]